MTIIWYISPEIWSADRQNFVVVLGHFLPFYPHNSPKNKTIKKKKMKKTPGDIIILHKCTKNHDHRLYCSWDMAQDGCNWYFSFWAIFCSFTSLTTRKMKISKKCMEMSSFNTTVPKIIIICFTVPEIWRMTGVIVIFHFGLCFSILPPYQLKKQKFQKNEKNTWRYHHSTHVYQKLWLDDVWFLRYGAWQMDGQIEKVTCRGGYPT